MPGQRLLAEIDLFKAPRGVLSDPKYWTRDFVRHFIEAWDDVAYVDPQAGMRLAETAVDLVEKLDGDARQILRPRALATLGSSYRTLEQLCQAEKVFAEVTALHAGILVPRLDEADFCRRMAYLRMDQRRFDDSLVFAQRTLVLARAEQADCELGRAYAVRGTVYLRMIRRGEAVPTCEPVYSLSRALERIDPRKASCAYEAAIGNLALALLQGYTCDLDRVLTMLKRTLHLQARLRITRRTGSASSVAQSHTPGMYPGTGLAEGSRRRAVAATGTRNRAPGAADRLYPPWISSGPAFVVARASGLPP